MEMTRLLAHSVDVDGRMLNVLGYQNKAKNKAWPRRPNAMILPFPAAEYMTQINCIDMTRAPNVLKEYSDLLRPRMRTRDLTKGLRSAAVASVEVFDSGSYTIALARNATDIPSALEQIPASKRPDLHPEIFDAYELWYPGWPVALCCWEGDIEAEPLLWWYKPKKEFQDFHFLPGLDGHEGGVPDPARKSVPVDHSIIIGGPAHDLQSAEGVLKDVPDKIRTWLPEYVYGDNLGDPTTKQMRNGDWVLPKGGWTRGNMRQRVQEKRKLPPGYIAARRQGLP
jgi:hypothetical protein